MSQTTVSPTNKAVSFRDNAKLPKHAKKAARKLSKSGHISDKALKRMTGEDA